MDDDELSENPEVQSNNEDINLISEIESKNPKEQQDKIINEPNVVDNKNSIISCELDIKTIDNPMFKSLNNNLEKGDEKPKEEGDDDINFSNLKINDIPIEQSQNQDDNNRSKNNEPKLQKKKTDTISETSEMIKILIQVQCLEK